MILLIGNQPFVPGQPLSFRQMAAVQLALATGNPVNPEVLAQYNAQGGQAWIAENLAANAQPVPAQTAAGDAQTAQPANPIAQPQQQVNATGTVFTPPAVTAPSNADPVVTLDNAGGDQNTDPPVRTLAQTQAITSVNAAGEAIGFGVRTEDGTLSNLRRNSETGELYDPGGITSAAADIDPGVGANDNNPPPSPVQTQAAVNAASPTRTPTQPQPNVLDKFANYTYSAAVYLLSPAQFAAYQLAEKKTVNGYNLLFQSGGAPSNIGGPQGAPAAGAPDAGRNPFFPNDYYIDSIKIANKPFGKNTSAAHSVTDLKFTVIEPANISLIDNIYLAVQDIAPKAAGKINYAAAIYLMVIRFYGYDLNGKLQRIGAADPAAGLSDSNAIVEKYIPFRIKNINWSVQGKLVTYDFDCAPVGQLIAGGTKRGTIPADIELTGATVSAMLKGQAIYGTVPAASAPGTPTTADRTQVDGRGRATAASDPRSVGSSPPKATAAPTNKKTIQQGLIEAMNLEQQRLVKAGTYSVADQYELIFANGAKSIEDATVAKPGKPVNKSATSVSAPAAKDPSAASPDKGSMDTTSRNMGITAGMQLLQAIELVIRNSSYITDQANLVINEVSGEPEPKPGSQDSDFKWFSILMQATPLDYDEKRNDFAYKIQYIIVPYRPSEMRSSYFPGVKFPGTVKKYPYWFTGENTSVLSYQATFNKLYIQTLTGSSPETSALAAIRRTQATSMREIPFISYQSRSTESSAGADGKTNELAANAAEYLYNPADNASAKIKILGDPAFIQQGSVTNTLNPNRISYAPFAADGTINFDTQDVLFEIAWQRPEDYDLQTGLADPYSRTQRATGNRQPIQSIVYRVKEVVSNFVQGKFEQDIDAVIYNVPIPQKSNTAVNAAPAAGAGLSDEEILARQNPGGLSDEEIIARGGIGSSQAAQSAAAQQASTLGTGPRAAEPPPTNQDDGSYDRTEFARLGRITPAPLPPPEPVSSNGEDVEAELSPEQGIFGAGRRLLTVADESASDPQIGNRDY